MRALIVLPLLIVGCGGPTAAPAPVCSEQGAPCQWVSDCCPLVDTFARIQESYHAACVNETCCKVMIAEGTDSDGKTFRTDCITCGGVTSCTYTP